MGYLEEFQTQINNRDFSKFLQLWEEYCTSDSVETDEFVELLKSIKVSDFAKLFGQCIETALPLWQTIKNEEESYLVLKYLIDLETTNTPLLADITLEALTKKYGKQPEFNDRLRLIGMRNKEHFQSALSNYDLLNHIKNGKFVFHNGGWGAGQIVDLSQVREQLAVEFENVAGRKHITFANAFKTLIPLSDDNFLARRFADADRLEKEAKEDPVKVIKILLRDVGPKSAAELKDELCELVIPEPDWTKWWQGARAKIKKDTIIETPTNIKNAFRLRKTEVTHEERLQKAMHNKINFEEVLQTSYNFVRDLPNMLKKPEVKNSLKAQILALLNDPALTKAQELQTLIFLDNHFSHIVEDRPLAYFIKNLKNVEETINAVEIIAFKKRALTLVRENRSDWDELFLSLLFSVQQGTLRDYIIKELNQGDSRNGLIDALKGLLKDPEKHPELFVWFFQKIVSKGHEDLPFSDKEGQCLFFEAFLILYSIIESKPEYRELIKKMNLMLSGKRFAVVRYIIEGTKIEFLKEFLLLVSKCQTLTDHDVKILRSLAEVVHPTLASAKSRKNAHTDGNIIWTTEAGYLKTQERARQIGTIDILENAREIEAARALGDLRENSEYKFALEKRSRLQSELKTLSDLLGHARLITPNDIHANEVGVGSVVNVVDTKGSHFVYSVLGPWDADADSNILSFQSKLAQTILGLKIGETFEFRGEEFKIVSFKSYLDK
ncbi:MAG: GreA/GreB family elongation factor [Parachlamydiaceae bacterium]|nr:GreA/GreB family elongation factor [Parachlamydiaceae bacterium]